MSISEINISKGQEVAFEQGFYGAAFSKFEKLGPKTVRAHYEGNKLASEIEYNAAEIWLKRKDRAEAKLAIALTLAIPALGLLVSGLHLVLAFRK